MKPQVKVSSTAHVNSQALLVKVSLLSVQVYTMDLELVLHLLPVKALSQYLTLNGHLPASLNAVLATPQYTTQKLLLPEPDTSPLPETSISKRPSNTAKPATPTSNLLVTPKRPPHAFKPTKVEILKLPAEWISAFAMAKSLTVLQLNEHSELIYPLMN